MEVMLYVVVYDNSATQPSPEHILDTSDIDLFDRTEIESVWTVIKEYDPQLAEWLGAAATKLSKGDPTKKALLLTGETIVTAVLLSHRLADELSHEDPRQTAVESNQLKLWED